MNEVLKGGTTLLYVSHNLNEVKRLCQHVIWLHKGKVVMIGGAEEVCRKYEEEMGK